MDRSLLPATFALLTACGATAQYQNVQLSDATRIRCTRWGADQAYMAVERRFAFDSSYVEFLQADAGWTITPLSSRRFAQPLGFLFDAVGTGDGMLCTGVLSYLSTPYMYKVDNDGSMGWARSLVGMAHAQTRIAKLFANGTAWYGYTNADGFFGSGMYRVQGDAAGSAFSIREITVANLIFRFYEGVTAGSGDSHVLCGAGMLTGGGAIEALLGHCDGSGATWMKQYSVSSAAGAEEALAVCRTVAGGYACVINAPEGTAMTAGHLLRTDAAGNVLGCTKIARPSGIYLTAVTTLDDGSLLAAGATNAGTGMLFKFSPAGTLLWSRACTNCIYNTINAFYRNGNNDLFALGPNTIFGLGPDGLACNFSDVADVVSSSVSPVVADMAPVNNLSPAVSTAPLTLFERTPVNTSSPVCEGTAVAEPGARQAIVAWPVPTGGVVHLGNPGQVGPREEVVMRDASGRVVFRGHYAEGIDLGALAPGVYTGELPRTGLFFRSVRM
ncbi:MAG: hypothetical protein KBH07_04365 [Flavobacteriales bacterium]|nr:hypothetical protein [Flavobacteriales bacterium]